MQAAEQPGSGGNGNGADGGLGLEINIDVVDLASLRAKWGHQFTFENELLADKSAADRFAALIDALICEVGAENLSREITTISIGQNMGVLFTSRTFIYSVSQSLADNIRYVCNTFRIPLPPAYQETAASDDGPTEFGEPPEFTDAEPIGEPTQVVRARAFPREWEAIDPGHNATVLVQIGKWEADFCLEALGEDGCFLHAELPRNLRPFPLDHICQLAFDIPNQPPLLVKGEVTSASCNNRGGATIRIQFQNMSDDDRERLAQYRISLREPPMEARIDATAGPNAAGPEIADEQLEEALDAGADADALPRIATGTRRRIGRTLGAVAAGVFLVVAGAGIYLAATPPKEPMEMLPLVPLVRKPTSETVSCSVLFDERGYRAKCPGASKPRLAWAPGQQKGAPVLRASIAFDRNGKRCKTDDPVTVIRGQTMPAVAQTFTCGGQPQ
ncbi:PilZ domain-containing protein [Candidatus Peregrinibacteria bacterium]|nr:PilZ domain-containing protein [Candidatus Peregrinibacteria bacterium]